MTWVGLWVVYDIGKYYTVVEHNKLLYGQFSRQIFSRIVIDQ
ncbi:protein of unknown function [Xenorhabdus doucetiae]|uniref:Uncharacterized protein n=1 Tax=Xenorhabdus doucetiae TaxID=351671 RepID=A0A068QQ08_9GAMM|nr:protein of unknown function [Xenorhabdus doucetiae]